LSFPPTLVYSLFKMWHWISVVVVVTIEGIYDCLATDVISPPYCRVIVTSLAVLACLDETSGIYAYVIFL